MSTLNVNNINEAGGVDAVITAGILDSGSLPASIPADKLPDGSILQVVQATTTVSTTTTSTSFVNTSATGSITPSSATSKILVLFTGGEFGSTSNSSSSAARLYRGDVTGTALGGGNMGTSYTGNAMLKVGPIGITFLDSPATASSVTYTVGIKSQNGADTTSLKTQQTMVLMEVAA